MRQSQAGQHGLGLVRELVAAAPLEALSEVPVLGQSRLKLAALRLRQDRLELAQALLQAAQPADSLQNQLVDGQSGRAGRLLLGQVADLDTPADRDPAALRWELAGHDPQHRALAGAVR